MVHREGEAIKTLIVATSKVRYVRMLGMESVITNMVRGK